MKLDCNIVKEENPFLLSWLHFPFWATVNADSYSPYISFEMIYKDPLVLLALFSPYFIIITTMDLKNLLCNTRLVPSQPMCPASPVDTWSSSDSCQSTPSLSSCSSTFSSPSTLYLPISASDQAPSQQTQTRTPWSASEDFLLQKGYSQGLSWAMISSTYLPHRSRGCCWGRFKTLQAKLSEHREWTTSEDHLLLLAIKKQDRLFKQAWKAVARELGGNRSWRECDVRSLKLNRVVRKQQHRKHPY